MALIPMINVLTYFWSRGSSDATQLSFDQLIGNFDRAATQRTFRLTVLPVSSADKDPIRRTCHWAIIAAEHGVIDRRLTFSINWGCLNSTSMSIRRPNNSKYRDGPDSLLDQCASGIKSAYLQECPTSERLLDYNGCI